MPKASGENPGQDDPGAAGVLDLDPGPEAGHKPWVIQRSGTRQVAMPGNATAEPATAAQTTRAQEDTAARSIHPLFRHHAERRER